MKIRIRKLKNIFKGLPRKLALHPFLSFWGLFILALIISGIIFYEYSVLVEKPEVEVPKEPLRFKEEAYREVKNQWQKREESLGGIGSKKYTNLFELTKKISATSSPGGSTSTPEEVSPEESPPEEIILLPELEKLLTARSLFEFYWLKGEKLPSIYQREIMWQKKGLGPAGDYKGSKEQNLILLEVLKKELTE